MSMIREHRIPSRWAMISLMLLLGVSAQAQPMNMNLSISFKSSFEADPYPPGSGMGEFLVVIRWTIVPPNVVFYDLYADGEPCCVVGPKATSGSISVIFKTFSSQSAFNAAIEQYLSQRHSYMVTAEYGAWGTYYDTYVYEPPDVLQIENRVEGFSDEGFCPLQIRYAQNTSEGFGPDYDIPYVTDVGLRSADIFSLLPAGPGESEHKLKVDCRPKGSASDVDLRLQFATASGKPVEFPSATSNELRFSIPSQERGYAFDSLCITIQPYDPFLPDVTYPRWDVRQIIQKNAGGSGCPTSKGRMLQKSLIPSSR